MRILFVSQLAAPGCRDGLPDEAAEVPVTFAALGVAIVFVDATTAERLPDPQGFDGVVVGGSVGSANDREPWRVALEAWLLAHPEVPLFGICGGHQLLARALGGRVEPMGRRQVGVFPLELAEIPGFGGRVLQIHGEHVVEPPERAEVWARDGWCIQALRYPGHRWTTQFHPEFTPGQAALVAATCEEAPEGWTDAGIHGAAEDGKVLLRAWLDGLRSLGRGGGNDR